MATTEIPIAAADLQLITREAISQETDPVGKPCQTREVVVPDALTSLWTSDVS